jgi:type IV pilus biogenesis protein PilP
MNKNIAALEEKATDNAKSTLKTLDGTDALTLDDLNRARQTVARIDAMIDIEKRLGELEKLRDGKNGGSSSNFANAIPASALTPMPRAISRTPSFPTGQEMPVVMHVAPSKPEISRIVGADGKYEAVLKMSDGETRTVRIGDTLNGGTVRWITPSAVGFDEKGQTSVLHIKNVDIVSSALH